MKLLMRCGSLLLMVAALSHAACLSGKWKFFIELDPVGYGDPIFTFVQKGTTVTGKYLGALGENEVTGSVNGDYAEFSFTYNRGGKVVKAIYSGVLESSNRMSGKLRFDGFFGRGTWTATREQ